jgi:hypothetical protein
MQLDKESDSDAGEQEQSDTCTASRTGSIRVSGTDQGSAGSESARSLGVKLGWRRSWALAGVSSASRPLTPSAPAQGGVPACRITPRPGRDPGLLRVSHHGAVCACLACPQETAASTSTRPSHSPHHRARLSASGESPSHSPQRATSPSPPSNATGPSLLEHAFAPPQHAHARHLHLRLTICTAIALAPARTATVAFALVHTAMMARTPTRSRLPSRALDHFYSSA